VIAKSRGWYHFDVGVLIMQIRKHVASGFTLVEILIVVVILGILAAIVIPQFTSASETARGSSLVTQLQTIRSQLELAQVQHVGTYPTLLADGDWNSLTTATEPVAAYTAGNASGNEVGPYLQKAPTNPFMASSTIAAAAAADVGWIYNDTNGVITAVMSAAKYTEMSSQIDAADVTTY
jgi:general secretion pathway protein G